MFFSIMYSSTVCLIHDLYELRCDNKNKLKYISCPECIKKNKEMKFLLKKTLIQSFPYYYKDPKV